jgi:hypothetical protein
LDVGISRAAGQEDQKMDAVQEVKSVLGRKNPQTMFFGFTAGKRVEVLPEGDPDDTLRERFGEYLRDRRCDRLSLLQILQVALALPREDRAGEEAVVRGLGPERALRRSGLRDRRLEGAPRGAEPEVGVVGEFLGAPSRALARAAEGVGLEPPGDALQEKGPVGRSRGFAESLDVAVPELPDRHVPEGLDLLQEVRVHLSPRS